MSVIRTNYHRRDVVYGTELFPDERAKFDYLDWSKPDGEGWSRKFVAFKGEFYDLDDFERTNFHGAPAEFQQWDGYQSDSFYSGILIRYVDADNKLSNQRWACEFVQVAIYWRTD